jgi:hypothetical protein
MRKVNAIVDPFGLRCHECGPVTPGYKPFQRLHSHVLQLARAMANLERKGLICDSGRRRNGQVVWVAREVITELELMVRETVQKFRKHRGGTDEWWYRRKAWRDIQEEAQRRFGLQGDEDETVVLKAFNEAWKADEAAVEGDQDSGGV